MADVDVRFEPGWERQVLDLGEPVIEAGALIVERGQKARIPVSRDGSHGRQPGYTREHVHIERGRDERGPYRDVGSDATSPTGAPYPLFLELGTRPHVIRSHGNYPLRDHDGNVFGREVNHPGTRPYPWCRAALADLAGRTLP